jgi:hypothetical protein
LPSLRATRKRRRYRVGDISIAEVAGGSRIVHVRDRGRALRINATAASVLGVPGDELDGAAILSRLSAGNPEVARELLSRDALGLVRRLHARGALESCARATSAH